MKTDSLIVNMGNNPEEIKNIFIKDINIINDETGIEQKSNILIENNILKAISPELNIPSIEFTIINGRGLKAVPAFTDIHTHLREPGNEDEETIGSAKLAAFRGGVTTVFSMPNTNPCIDTDYLINFISMRAKQEKFDVFPVAAMTKNLDGLKMTEIGLLKKAGAIALSDDGRCVQDSRLMYEIMKYSEEMQLPLILHEEDYNFSKTGFVNEGYYSAKLGLDGILSLSEELMVLRDIFLAKKSKAKIHITHVSSKKSIELISIAKNDGVNITCDITPHHLFFNDSCLESFDTNFKVNPPIRSEEDRQAIIDGVKTGIIDAIASDHAPHLAIEKNTTLKCAAYGVIGLETLFSASYTILCKNEGVSLSRLIELTCTGPRKIFNLNQNNIDSASIGKKIDIALIDTKIKRKINSGCFFSKSNNSPFAGKVLNSDVVCTINKGKIVYLRNEEIN
jgi:dihydroorotase